MAFNSLPFCYGLTAFTTGAIVCMHKHILEKNTALILVRRNFCSSDLNCSRISRYHGVYGENRCCFVNPRRFARSKAYGRNNMGIFCLCMNDTSTTLLLNEHRDNAIMTAIFFFENDKKLRTDQIFRTSQSLFSYFLCSFL